MGKKYTPPSNYSIPEWVELVNTGFLRGQRFYLNNMQNQQEANGAQITLSLSTGEQEDTLSVDQEFSVQLDKEMNATPQRYSSQCKKVPPQKKTPIKPATLKQQVLKPTSKQQVFNSDVKDFFKDRIDMHCPKRDGEFGKHHESGNS